MTKEFYTVAEVAKETKLTPTRIRQLIREGSIDYQPFGKLLLITPKGIEDAKQRNTKRGRPANKAT